jgi:DGQHR domain-containing protein
LDTYIGIQRSLSDGRVTEIGKFVNTIDATFPTSIVLAVPQVCARYDLAASELTLTSAFDEETGDVIPVGEIAKILDGQHRIEGLKHFTGDQFQVPVSIFVDADIADQSYVFATVNLAQTKVNRSLVFDLLDFARARSPQKTCHDIVVALDNHVASPFHKKIKRLGTATPGRIGETITQATFVNALLPFLSADPVTDRDRMARGKRLNHDDVSYQQTPFRWLWLDDRDTDIARILIEFFGAVSDRWPVAWRSNETGMMLTRTNGFRALMRYLRHLYLSEKPLPSVESPVVPRARFAARLNEVPLTDSDFTTDTFQPGSSGEKALYDRLLCVR